MLFSALFRSLGGSLITNSVLLSLAMLKWSQQQGPTSLNDRGVFTGLKTILYKTLCVCVRLFYPSVYIYFLAFVLKPVAFPYTAPHTAGFASLSTF